MQGRTLRRLLDTRETGKMRPARVCAGSAPASGRSRTEREMRCPPPPEEVFPEVLPGMAARGRRQRVGAGEFERSPSEIAELSAG